MHGKKKRNLSIVGKVCIIQIFLISQLVYIMQALVVPDSFSHTGEQIVIQIFVSKERL